MTKILTDGIFTSCWNAAALAVIRVLGAVAKVAAKGGLDGKAARIEFCIRDGHNVGEDYDSDDDTLVNQRARYRRFMKWQTTSIHTATNLKNPFRNLLNDALAWGSTSTPVSVFDPLTGERRVPAQDPVYILDNPWVHEQDEVVAVLRLPLPPDVVSPESKYEFRNSTGTIDTKCDSASLPLPTTTLPEPDRDTHFPTHSNQPLYFFELVALACTLKQSKPEYRVLTSNCYWYCTMILHLVRLRHGLNLSYVPEPHNDHNETSKYSYKSSLRARMTSSSNKTSDPRPGSLATDTSAEKKKKSPLTWKSNLDADVNAVGLDLHQHQFPVPPPSPSPSLTATLSSFPHSPPSWYSSKMGTWYGVRVTKTPTDLYLLKWLSKAEKAIEQFRNEVCARPPACCSFFLGFPCPVTSSLHFYFLPFTFTPVLWFCRTWLAYSSHCTPGLFGTPYSQDHIARWDRVGYGGYDDRGAGMGC